jgi:hypothetical protein
LHENRRRLDLTLGILAHQRVSGNAMLALVLVLLGLHYFMRRRAA